MHKLAKDGLLKDMFKNIQSEDEDVCGFDPRAGGDFAHWTDEEEAESSSSYAWNDEDEQTCTSTSFMSAESNSVTEGPDALFVGFKKKKKKMEEGLQIYNGAQLLCPDDSFSDSCAFVFAK